MFGYIFQMQKLRNHNILTVLSLVLLMVILTACSNSTDTDLEKKVKLESPRVCTHSSLASTSKKFLEALKAEDVEMAKSFYKSTSYAEGDYHGVSYTFFPKKNEHNIFDFQKANAVSEFEVNVLGEYNYYDNDGMLALFIQQAHASKNRDEKFLSETKFKNHFVCYFECNDNDVWKITGYRCFEDSGGPFFPACEEGETDEYCPTSQPVKE